MLEVHVGKNMYKGGRVLYNVRSTHPSTTHTHKKEQQQKKTTKKTHTHKHLLWYGAERAVVSRLCTPARKRRYHWSYSARHKFVVTRELVASYCHGNILD